MHVARTRTTVKGRTYESVLVRQSYRVGPKVKHRTLASLTHLPAHVIEVIERAIRGEALVAAHEALTIARSWPHGHVAAVLGAARQLQLEGVLDPQPSRERDLVLGMIVARVLQPVSKLATTRLLVDTTLGSSLGIEDATEDELYGAMDWLRERQVGIEQRLATRYLEPGGLVLYDLSSVYLEGRHCPLARRGYSRDGRQGSLQVEFGLLTSADGWPVAIEAFAGDTADPATLPGQVSKVRERFGIAEVVWVSDRGLLTERQVEQLRGLPGMGWITALRAPTIQRLVEQGAIQLSLFDRQNLAEIDDPQHPGERLVLCHNPLRATERARKRDEMLAATERELAKVARMVERGAAGGRSGLRGAAAIGERVGRVVNKYKMAKHFSRQITDTSLSYSRNEASIAEEAALDGLYVLRTNVAKERLATAEVVLAYKRLGQIERAFRHFKLSDLQVRPVYHYREDRVRAHLLLCMLSYWVQRALERALASLVFVDQSPPERPDPVAAAPRSDAAKRKEQTKHTAEGLPVQRFRSLLGHLATLTKNRVVPFGATDGFDLYSAPTPLQARAFELLQLKSIAP